MLQAPEEEVAELVSQQDKAKQSWLNKKSKFWSKLLLKVII